MTDSAGPVAKPAARRGESSSTPSPAVERAPTGGLLDLQRGAGNQAVGGLLTRAAGDPGRPLDPPLRQRLERGLVADLSAVRLHDAATSAAAAETLGARAYTIGSDIHLGREAHTLDAASRDQLLAHEAVHAVQQGGRPVALDGVMSVGQPGDASEAQARIFAARLSDPAQHAQASSGSRALALRDELRTTAVAPHIQRDIVGSKKFPVGEFSINFTKTDAAAAGDHAIEDGIVKFMPSATAPESDSIKFIQVVRDFNVTTGKQVEWGDGEENRNKMQTKRDFKNNVAPGFFVDHFAATQKPRTAKADPRVSAFYMDTPPVLKGNKEGKRRGKTIEPAQLDDGPGSTGARKFNFITVAKAADTVIVYGTVLWGFETFVDKGKAKIKNEYKSFRTFEGETFVEALKQFNEFYKNQGTPGAPRK